MPDIDVQGGPTGGSSTPSAAPVSSPAPATAVPAPAISSSSSTPSAVQPVSATPASGGEPPQDRWPDILDNARKKTRAEVEQEFRQKYAPYESFERDPWSAVQQWLGEAGQHSLYSPMVKQWAEQYMRAQGPADFGAEPEADVPIVDANGHQTGQTYSDKQLRAWHRWNKAQQDSELNQRFGALEQREQQRAQRDQQHAIQQHAVQSAATTLATLRAMPYFAEHEPAIRHALNEHEEWGDNIHAAYNHVLTTQILPTLGQAEQQKVITSIQQKTSGATVSPIGAASGRPQFKNFRDAAEYFEKHPDEAKVMAERQG